MTAIDKDPQLNSMLWDGVKSNMEKMGREWAEYRTVMAKRIGEGLENLFATYFAQHPNVEALAFSLTTSEYDDEGYGGYNFTSVRPKFNHEGLSAETRSFLNTEEDEYSAGYLETVRYTYGGRSSDFPSEITPAINQCNEIDKILDQVTDFARVHWGENGVKVTRDKIYLFASADDLT